VQVDVPKLNMVETMCIANVTTDPDEYGDIAEIRVTREMIEAGEKAMERATECGVVVGVNWSSLVKEVYTAMALMYLDQGGRLCDDRLNVSKSS